MVESRKKFTQEMVDSIFSFSELGYQEQWTADYVTKILKKRAFRSLAESPGCRRVSSQAGARANL